MYSDFEAASGGVSCAMTIGATTGHKIALPKIPNCEYLPSMIFKNRLFGLGWDYLLAASLTRPIFKLDLLKYLYLSTAEDYSISVLTKMQYSTSHLH